jgi:hypothetical protein
MEESKKDKKNERILEKAAFAVVVYRSTCCFLHDDGGGV